MKTYLLTGLVEGAEYRFKVTAASANLVHALASTLALVDWDVLPWIDALETATAGKLQQIGGSVWFINSAN